MRVIASGTLFITVLAILLVPKTSEALTLKEALKQIQSLKTEVFQLKNRLSAEAITAVPVPPLGDSTPRIAYWYGKVNQYINSQGDWISDPDGTSGADIDKLTYCKKWYPNTIKVESYKNETINTWRRAIGFEQSGYINTVVTDKCVQGEVSAMTPSITILSPNGGETYQVGGSMNITWKSYNPENWKIDAEIKNVSTGISYSFYPSLRMNNDTGNAVGNIQTTVPPGQYVLNIAHQVNLGPSDSSDMPFTITNSTSAPTLECAINSFTANPVTVQYGEPSYLRWSTKDCTSGYLHDDEGKSLMLNGSMNINNLNNSGTKVYSISFSVEPGCFGSANSETNGKKCNYVTKSVTTNVYSILSTLEAGSRIAYCVLVWKS